VSSMQYHATGTVFAGSKSLQVDVGDAPNGVPEKLVLRGVMKYPSCSPTGGTSSGFTTTTVGDTHTLPFSFDSDGAGTQSIAEIPIIGDAHKGVIQITALGITNVATKFLMLAQAYTYSGGTLSFDGAAVDLTPLALAVTSSTLVLGVDDNVAPGITLYDAGDGATRVRWSGQIQITMTRTL
jgi:hypothetical protein